MMPNPVLPPSGPPAAALTHDTSGQNQENCGRVELHPSQGGVGEKDYEATAGTQAGHTHPRVRMCRGRPYGEAGTLSWCKGHSQMCATGR